VEGLRLPAELLLPLPLPLFFFFFFFPFCSFFLSRFSPLLCSLVSLFFLFSLFFLALSLSLTLFFFFFFFLSFCFSPSPFFFLPSPFVSFLPCIYRGEKETYTLAQSMAQGCRVVGAATVQPPLYHPRDTSPPLTLTRGKLCRWRVPGRRLFGSSGEGKAVKTGGRIIFFFPCLSHPGEEEDPQCRQNSTLSGFFFFNEQCMKWRRFGQNNAILFKWKRCQTYVKIQISLQFVICSIKSSIAILILKINSIASLPDLIVGLEVGRLFQIGHWSQISVIWPSIEQ